MKKDKKANVEVIRSELTHAQEVSLVYSPIPSDVIDRIQTNLKALEETSKSPAKDVR